MSGLGHGNSPADDATCNQQKADVGKSVERAAVVRVLTLDDFGGRSDALGG
jgi:hypothetical protein